MRFGTLLMSCEALALAAKKPLDAATHPKTTRRRNPRLVRRILTHLQRADENGDNANKIGFLRSAL
jgi:hypothetical protein